MEQVPKFDISIVMAKKLTLTVFDEILTSIYLEIAFILGLQTLQSIDLSRMYCLKGLEPKNKGYFQIDGC